MLVNIEHTLLQGHLCFFFVVFFTVYNLLPLNKRNSKCHYESKLSLFLKHCIVLEKHFFSLQSSVQIIIQNSLYNKYAKYSEAFSLSQAKKI